MEKNKNCENEEIFCIKFTGEKFEEENGAVPIYQLGQVLISFQQIIYKIFTYKNKIPVGNKEREKLALKMTSRRKGSDAYGFTAFLSDPIVHAFLAPLVVDAVIAIGEYASGKISQILSRNEPPDKYLAAIFPQLCNIQNRIESFGGVCHIQVSVPNGPSVSLDTETRKDVIEDVKGAVFYDTEREIRGIVTQFYTKRNMVIIDAEQIGNVKVYLEREDFRKIRYETQRDTIVTIKGNPRYQYGRESYLKFEEFKANSIMIEEND